MIISPIGKLPVKPGPDDYFTGDVSLRPLFGAKGDSRMSGVQVTFPPSARTAWHTHPVGQMLIITEGAGRIQVKDGEVMTVVAGDVVRFDAGEVHWHGAARDVSMTHLALQEEHHGSAVTWLDPVSDRDYSA